MLQLQNTVNTQITFLSNVARKITPTHDTKFKKKHSCWSTCNALGLFCESSVTIPGGIKNLEDKYAIGMGIQTQVLTKH